MGKFLGGMGLSSWILQTKRAIRIFLRKAQARWETQLYLRANSECVRLNIATGGNVLPGWLNIDILPIHGTVHIDVLKRLPFEDETVHFINCEHFVEHIPYQTCEWFLRECFRVLRKGGTLRISTPSLRRLIQHYQGDGALPMGGILAHHRRCHNPIAESACAWFNDTLRLWGHCFVFDEATLTQLLRRAGFERAVQCNFGESRYPSLRGVEHDGEGAEWERKACVMILEAEKTGVAGGKNSAD